MDKEKEIIIDTEEIAEYLASNLFARGYIPTDDELYEIADIIFDYLIDKSIIDNVE